jgi:ribosomal protein S18 acetylase RimI-like enzyme
MLPGGLQLRPVRPEQYQAILQASNEAFADHWGNTTTSWEEFEGWIKHPDTDTLLWHVAWDGAEIAGMVFGVIPRAENVEYQRRRGMLVNVGVRRPWRGRGLARALLAHAMRALQTRAITEAVLDVDTENTSGALRLYESLGFAPIRRVATYRKELLLAS